MLMLVYKNPCEMKGNVVKPPRVLSVMFMPSCCE